MFLACTFTNLLFGCVYRNGNFTTNFTVYLDDDQSRVFNHCTFVCYRPRRVCRYRLRRPVLATG